MAINFLNTVAVDDNVLFVDTINDRVGIGTDSPDSLLEISQQLSATATIDYPYTISSRDDGNSINQVGGEGVGIKFKIAGNAATTPGDSLVGASIAAIRESSGDTDSSTGLGLFITQNDETLDEAVRIDHDGNVGIGTTSPDRKLEVDFTGSTYGAKFTRSDAAGSSLVEFANSAGVKNKIGYDAGIDGFHVGTASATNLVVKQNGNVGIGTTSPTANLHIEGGTNNEVLKIEADVSPFIRWVKSGSDVGFLQFTSTSAYLSNMSNGSFFFRTNNTDKMTITSAGNVGIGTTNPLYKLQVQDRIHIQDTTSLQPKISFSENTNTSGEFVLEYNGVGGGSGNYVSFYSEVFGWVSKGNGFNYIPSTGSVGIGTTSPGEKLDVNGNIKIKNALLSNQENTDIDSAAAEVVAQVAHATYTAAFFDFVVKKGTNVRSGTVYACHNGDTTPLVEFTETSTNDLGDTSDVVLSVDISGANMRLVATVASDDWSVKSLVKAI